MRSLDGLYKDRGRAFKAGDVRYAFSYWLNAFSFFATASRSASAAAGRCALGADRGGIAHDSDVVNGGMAGCICVIRGNLVKYSIIKMG